MKNFMFILFSPIIFIVFLLISLIPIIIDIIFIAFLLAGIFGIILLPYYYLKGIIIGFLRLGVSLTLLGIFGLFYENILKLNIEIINFIKKLLFLFIKGEQL